MVLVQWTLGYMCLFQFWFPQARCLGVGLLGYMVVLFLIFKGLSILSSIVSVSIYIFTNSARAFPFFHILSSSCCLQTFRWWPFWPVWGDISLCFGFRFSNNEWCWASFHVFVSHLCLLWRNVCLGLFPTFWLGCLFFCHWVVWAACIFWKLILCQLFHFLPFWGLSFHLVHSFLCCAKAVKFNQVPLTYFF